MMISSFYLNLNYFLSLLLFFNYSNPILFWILMEYNLISFILILYSNKMSFNKWDSMNYLIFYFLIQSSSSILFLSNFSIYDWFSIFNCDAMFISSIVFKIGLFPLFFWVFSLSESLSLYPLIILLTFQKIPLFCGLFTSNSSLLLLILLFSFLMGSLMLFFSPNLLFMFICSSISYSFMLFFVYAMDILFFVSFFILYSFFLFICLSFKKNKVMDSNFDLFLVLSYVFFLGLPPLGLFFYKFIFVSFLFSLMGPLEVLVFWLFSFFSLIGYIKFFYQSFFSSSSLYNFNSKMLFSCSLQYWLILLIFLFLLV